MATPCGVLKTFGGLGYRPHDVFVVGEGFSEPDALQAAGSVDPQRVRGALTNLDLPAVTRSCRGALRPGLELVLDTDPPTIASWPAG